MPWVERAWGALAALGCRAVARAASLRRRAAEYAGLARAAWREQAQQAPRIALRGKELEFLPAVLEIQESPASPVGRATLWAIVAVFAIAVLWACLGRIDIVAVARGKIIPNDYTKVIQPLESGVISAIHVRDGQHVHRGDLLIELDPTMSGADEERYTSEYLAAQTAAARLQALLEGRNQLAPPEGASPEFVALQQRLLTDQLAEHQARLAAARLVIDQRQAALAATRADVRRLERTVPILEQRAEAYKKMLARQFVPELQYLEVEEQRIDKVQELAAAREQRRQDEAALAEARKNYDATESEFRKTIQAELADIDTRATSLSKEVVKAAHATHRQHLTAPVDGVVQQLAVHTVGGVVTPAQPLLVIVPQEGTLEVEAWVENKDIGFVNPDQRAEVKIDAFPFTRYGTIDATVVNLSRDAVVQENKDYAYAARVALKRAIMRVENGKDVLLTPGMTVTVEIKTGQRRLISYFLSPLIQGVSEGMRER